MVTRHDELLRLYFHCLLCFFGALFYNSNFPLIMVVEYSIVRVVGLSSNKKAFIDINTMSRRISVTPLSSATGVKPYDDFGCGYLRCAHPDITCINCQMNIIHQYITKRR